MRSESFVGGSIVLSREFLTANPTPCKRGSLFSLPEEGVVFLSQ